MPPAIDAQIRGQVIKEWLSGNSRDEIAANNKIGAGTVSNIINEWKKGIDNKDYGSIRELSLSLNGEGTTFNDLSPLVRLNNCIKKMGADFDQIESFIANIADSEDPQKLIDTTNQIAQLSEPIPLDKIPEHIKLLESELEKLKEEIKKAGAILGQKNIDIQTIEEYKKLEEELENYGFSMESSQKLVSVLLKINQLGYDPLKIVSFVARIKSLRGTERVLKKNCTTLELRAARFREVLPMCEQVMRLRIGFSELVAFHTAVIKRADSGNIPTESAAYRVMEEIESYKELED